MSANTKPKSKGIVSWSAQERPRERLLSRGPQELTDAELIAILLRVGIRGKSAVELGHELLKRFADTEGLGWRAADCDGFQPRRMGTTNPAFGQ